MRFRVATLGLTLAACGGTRSPAIGPQANGTGQPGVARVDASVDDPGPTPSDAGRPPPLADGNMFQPGGRDPASHGAPTPITLRSVGGLDGTAVVDVAVDAASAVWASTAGFVLYLQRGAAPRRYTAADGLANGDGSVAFAGVGAGEPGQAFIGTIGKWADVVDVRPGGSLDVHHLTIEDPVHAEKITRAFRFAVDLDSAWGGTVWVGSEHGHSTVHGVATGYCWGQYGCFEEHRHSDPGGGPAGDVKGLAVCPNHDLWTGDAWWVARMPWGGVGTQPDFWSVPPGGYPTPLVDAFPGVDDNVSVMACDEVGGLWVGSWGNGLVYLEPVTTIAHYFDAADTLPQNIITALALDPDGSLWIGTGWAGLARYRAAGGGAWTYYAEGAGLPSNAITALAIDATTSPRTLYIGHLRGLSAYQGP
jgi:hypothetical protein